MAEGLKPVTTQARDLFRRPMLPDELARMDAIVLDPPRAGAERQVVEIIPAKVPRIAYVSCNPVTFALRPVLMPQCENSCVSPLFEQPVLGYVIAGNKDTFDPSGRIENK